MAETIEDTGWQKINPVAQAVDTRTEQAIGASGLVDMVTGLEERPCCMCRFWDDVDKNKIIRHLLSKGLKPREDGKFETPIAKDFAGRNSMVLDPLTAGMCRVDVIITDGLATCPRFEVTRTLSEFQQRMMRR